MQSDGQRADEPARAELLVRLRDVIAAEVEHVSPEAVRPGARLVEDLALESIDFVNVGIALEERLGVEWEVLHWEGVETVDGVLDVILSVRLSLRG